MFNNSTLWFLYTITHLMDVYDMTPHLIPNLRNKTPFKNK